MKKRAICVTVVAVGLLSQTNKSWTALDRRFNAAGVTGCQLNRQA